MADQQFILTISGGESFKNPITPEELSDALLEVGYGFIEVAPWPKSGGGKHEKKKESTDEQ
jgi:hypothetical protein